MMLRILLVLALRAQLAHCLPDSKRASPSAPDSCRPCLFSTHSKNSWSRSNGLWHRDTLSGVSNSRNDTVVVALHDPEDGHLVCFYPEDLSLSNSLKQLLHGCHGTRKSFIRVIALALWIPILFYLLASTASDYFSCTLEKLSAALKLSPAVAGVTLLAIGNGAPDVFSSIAAFVSSDRAGSIGFGCVLGGALFVTTVVSGTVALVTARVCNKAGYQRISFVCFVRDALFLLASAGVITVILLDGKVHLWEAISFLCVYVVYAASVWVAEMLENCYRGSSSVLDPLTAEGEFFLAILAFWGTILLLTTIKCKK